jgi:HEPN domain-containing protein
LDGLLLEASKNHPVLMELKRSVKHLDAVYFSTRYPDSIAGDITPGEYYDKEDAEECIHQVENILKAVKNTLNI